MNWCVRVIDSRSDEYRTLAEGVNVANIECSEVILPGDVDLSEYRIVSVKITSEPLFVLVHAHRKGM